jgi:uncharacterized membrane protein YkoI
MKSKIIICGLLAGGLLAGSLAATTQAADKEGVGDKAKLEAQAKISKAEAQKIALAEVKTRGLKRAKVKEGELEEENGKLIWSFDIATKGTKDITEVQVDAKTGAVVSVETEKAADEAKEKKGKQDKDEKEEKK